MAIGPFETSQFIARLIQGNIVALDTVLHAADEFNEDTLSLAKSLCPVDTGALVASGTAEPAEVIDDVIVGQIGFNVHYAIYVHENLEAHHPIGQAKYLEAAMQQMYPKAGPFMANALKGVSA